MRAMLWIAASGFLLASGSAYAHAEPPKGEDVAVHADHPADAPPASVDVTMSHPDPRGAATDADTSRMQPARTGPREKPEARTAAVTVDLDHPGGEFPSGG